MTTTTPTPTTAAQALALAAELRELSSKATPGAWRALSGHHEICEIAIDNPAHAADESCYSRIGIDCGFGLQASDNQDFIVFARNNALAIADTLDALAQEHAKLREAQPPVEQVLQQHTFSSPDDIDEFIEKEIYAAVDIEYMVLETGGVFLDTRLSAAGLRAIADKLDLRDALKRELFPQEPAA